MTQPQTPSRNGYVTPIPPPRCLACDQTMPTGRARRYCSDRCRQTGWRRRNQADKPATPLPERGSRRTNTVYECPECESRYLGEQRCDDCSTFCRKVGVGGPCKCCDELITIDELLQS